MSKSDCFVHEKALCDSVHVGSGTRIWAFAHVLSGARIGRDCNICENVFIENKVEIGNGCTIKNNVSVWDYVTLEEGVFLGPSAVFTNDLRPRAFIKRGDSSFLPTLVKRGATIGANSTIVCGVTIGEYAMVAAGAVVTKHIPPHSLVVGNPARVVGRVCFCGEKLKEDDFCPACEAFLQDLSEEEATQRSLARIARRLR